MPLTGPLHDDLYPGSARAAACAPRCPALTGQHRGDAAACSSLGAVNPDHQTRARLATADRDHGAAILRGSALPVSLRPWPPLAPAFGPAEGAGDRGTRARDWTGVVRGTGGSDRVEK